MAPFLPFSSLGCIVHRTGIRCVCGQSNQGIWSGRNDCESESGLLSCNGLATTSAAKAICVTVYCWGEKVHSRNKRKHSYALAMFVSIPPPLVKRDYNVCGSLCSPINNTYIASVCFINLEIQILLQKLMMPPFASFLKLIWLHLLFAHQWQQYFPLHHHMFPLKQNNNFVYILKNKSGLTKTPCYPS